MNLAFMLLSLLPYLTESKPYNTNFKAEEFACYEKIAKEDHVKATDHIDKGKNERPQPSCLFQGDMILTESQNAQLAITSKKGLQAANRKKRQAFNYPNNTWTEGVNYCFDRKTSDKFKEVFDRAVEAWQRDTCIDFRENCSALDKILIITNGTGCASQVGKVGGNQLLYLGRRCQTFDNIVHELGHSLGLLHTMNRHDRDKYIILNEWNIKPDLLNEYKVISDGFNENYDMEYDYGSIMHYKWRSASRNGKPTMVPKDMNYNSTLGSEMIAFADLFVLNEHYECYEKCDDASSAKCVNGGFPHPRLCSKCICPSGYGGNLCNRRPSDLCGRELEATSEWKTLTDWMYEVKSENFLDGYDKCNYWIKSPNGTIIEIRIKTLLPAGQVRDGCVEAGVEIKAQKNQTLTGYRFCFQEHEGLTLTSHANLVPVIFYSRSRGLSQIS